MTRLTFIERILRQIYGGMPSDDAQITPNLVNAWLPDAIAAAAKANHADSLRLDGVSYVNGSFYTTFKLLPITQDEFGVWKITLPQIPVSLGADEGISTVKIKSTTNEISLPLIFMTQAQKSLSNMREIPNKVLAYSEGKYIYALTTIMLSNYTASVTMISGGLDNELEGELNVPPDYFPVMVEYIKGQLMFERSVPKDLANDGNDGPIKST